jgi:hypothetical protein
MPNDGSKALIADLLAYRADSAKTIEELASLPIPDRERGSIANLSAIVSARARSRCRSRRRRSRAASVVADVDPERCSDGDDYARDRQHPPGAAVDEAGKPRNVASAGLRASWCLGIHEGRPWPTKDPFSDETHRQ